MTIAQPAINARKPALAGNTDTSLLKIIALAFMIVDHVAVAFSLNMPELRVLGRIAMPLYAWSLVVGCEYTRNGFRYALRLFIIGVVSQPLYIMVLNGTWQRLNILFLLCIAVLAITGIEKRWYYSQYWAPALGFIIFLLIDIDYGWGGYLFILFLYISRYSKINLAAAFIASAVFMGDNSSLVSSFFGIQFSFLTGNIFSHALKLLFRMQTMMWLALPLILIQTHSHIKMPKWLGYGLYPLHLLVLLIIWELVTGYPIDWLLTAAVKFV